MNRAEHVHRPKAFAQNARNSTGTKGCNQQQAGCRESDNLAGSAKTVNDGRFGLAISTPGQSCSPLERDVVEIERSCCREASMTSKQLALERIRQLPANATLQDIAQEIALLASIREGEKDADEGRVVSQEEVERQVKK
jgi:predicted transcriptional regulator